MHTAVITSGLHESTKAVLIAIMDRGEGILTTWHDIRRSTGFSKQTIFTHLAYAKKSGWLTGTRVYERGRGGVLRGTVYRVKVPS